MIRELTRAYSDEWFAHYNYFLVANTLSGPSSPALSSLVRRKAERALDHANELAHRLLQLGGSPVPKLDELSKHSTNKPFKLPSNNRDTDRCLLAVLDAERTSILTYHRLLREADDADTVTRLLLTRLLAEAVDGESEIERLLGRPAPEMTGR